eukprot:gnl/MRDRNA2_/MRDRNA2_60119_c0_seq1.p1 gnl/MRDRNA2_/MRDRNA2_60119_c0~~gnl/MRDRNA2_/MRDRNA2_60119_c0_seq1.p1  ORF type:complete len:121 (+),score=4.74 gnl/MRDRNA2_/MRDRNA2_60119_c0_seq1:2-364(+)
MERNTIQDGRQLTGRFLAYDRHLNIVLGDCEEFRVFRTEQKKKEQREKSRVLGLTILRGESLISLMVEGLPPSDTVRTKLQTAPTGLETGYQSGHGAQVATSSYISPEIAKSAQRVLPSR